MRGTFSSGSPSHNAELDIVMSVFENSSVGPSYAAFRTGRFRRDCPKLGNDYVRKGGNFHLLSKIPASFLFQIDGDTDFAIKHDIISWIDQVLGVQR